MAIPIIKAAPSHGGSVIQGDVAVINFNREIQRHISWAEATVITQQVAGVAAVVLAAAFTGVQNDVPRNVQIDDNGVGAGNTGNVLITGLDQYGESVTETIAINTLGVIEGNVAFSYIISISFPAITDTNIEIQMMSKIGIPADLATGDLKTVAKDAAGAGIKVYMAAAAFTVNTAYDTVEETGVAVVAGDVYDYIVKG